ncbi:hypothetical protein HMI54_010201 [Coelomomyces lativittatus]|nr:hypothetical protein HMI55_001536 [Coelomomyces lativittatus]KAJ1514539.1 hypothetical protein HMI56_000256 [Coelomomyces lativittatus]KAJ1516267.1 hypothetical protein HMI54_010201 [Coelomomyces lativittatus]
MRKLVLLDTSHFFSIGTKDSLKKDPIFYALQTLLQDILHSLLSVEESHFHAVLLPYSFHFQFQQAFKACISIHLEPYQIYQLHSLRVWYVTSSTEWMAWLATYAMYSEKVKFYFISPSQQFLKLTSSKNDEELEKQWLRILSLLQTVPNWMILDFSDTKEMNSLIQLTQKYSEISEWMDPPLTTD